MLSFKCWGRTTLHHCCVRQPTWREDTLTRHGTGGNQAIVHWRCTARTTPVGIMMLYSLPSMFKWITEVCLCFSFYLCNICVKRWPWPSSRPLTKGKTNYKNHETKRYGYTQKYLVNDNIDDLERSAAPTRIQPKRGLLKSKKEDEVAVKKKCSSIL